MLEIADQVRSLLHLQTLDAERYDLRTELAATPKALAAERGALDGAIGRRDATGVEVKDKKKAIGADERAMEGVERRRDRAKKRMPNLSTSTQIEATQREIATLTEEAGEFEEKILLGMEELEELEASLEQQTQAVDAEEAALAGRLQTWTDRNVVLSARLTELDAEREPRFASLRADIARRYVLAWSQRYKPPSGVTKVDGFMCVTCEGRVSPRWIQESKNHTAIHACDNCKRLLMYDPDAVPEPPPAPEQADQVEA
jgi:predicted  nucleic acid-binding Zn-ribbon protein